MSFIFSIFLLGIERQVLLLMSGELDDVLRIQSVKLFNLGYFVSDLCIFLNKLIDSRMTYRHFLKTNT